MRHVPVKLGPLALLFAVIAICLTTLAVLTWSTALADGRLAARYAETVAERYALEREGQTLLRDAAAGDCGAFSKANDGTYETVLSRGDARLSIRLAADGRVLLWRHTMEWTEDTSLGTLWPGLGG